MSYYKGSGYGSRGGYRGGSSSGYRGGGGGGSGNGDSSWRGGRGGSSSFSSQRAVGGSSSGGGSSRYYGSSPPSSSYESRSRSSFVGGGSSSDRYSSRRDESYSRYQEMSSYGSRDYGRSGSPEPPRKRVREGSPYMGLDRLLPPHSLDVGGAKLSGHPRDTPEEELFYNRENAFPRMASVEKNQVFNNVNSLGANSSQFALNSQNPPRDISSNASNSERFFLSSDSFRVNNPPNKLTETSSYFSQSIYPQVSSASVDKEADLFDRRKCSESIFSMDDEYRHNSAGNFKGFSAKPLSIESSFKSNKEPFVERIFHNNIGQNDNSSNLDEILMKSFRSSLNDYSRTCSLNEKYKLGCTGTSMMSLNERFGNIATPKTYRRNDLGEDYISSLSRMPSQKESGKFESLEKEYDRFIEETNTFCNEENTNFDEYNYPDPKPFNDKNSKLFITKDNVKKAEPYSFSPEDGYDTKSHLRTIENQKETRGINTHEETTSNDNIPPRRIRDRKKKRESEKRRRKVRTLKLHAEWLSEYKNDPDCQFSNKKIRAGTLLKVERTKKIEDPRQTDNKKTKGNKSVKVEEKTAPNKGGDQHNVESNKSDETNANSRTKVDSREIIGQQEENKINSNKQSFTEKTNEAHQPPFPPLTLDFSEDFTSLPKNCGLGFISFDKDLDTIPEEKIECSSFLTDKLPQTTSNDVHSKHRNEIVQQTDDVIAEKEHDENLSVHDNDITKETFVQNEYLNVEEKIDKDVNLSEEKQDLETTQTLGKENAMNSTERNETAEIKRDPDPSEKHEELAQPQEENVDDNMKENETVEVKHYHNPTQEIAVESAGGNKIGIKVSEQPLIKPPEKIENILGQEDISIQNENNPSSTEISLNDSKKTGYNENPSPNSSNYLPSLNKKITEDSNQTDLKQLTSKVDSEQTEPQGKDASFKNQTKKQRLTRSQRRKLAKLRRLNKNLGTLSPSRTTENITAVGIKGKLDSVEHCNPRINEAGSTLPSGRNNERTAPKAESQLNPGDSNSVLLRHNTRQQCNIDKDKQGSNLQNLKEQSKKNEATQNSTPNINKEPISVLVRDENQSLGKIVGEKVKIFEESLLDLLVKALDRPNAKELTINSVGLVKGNYKIECQDEYSYRWLQTAVEKLQYLWEGANIKLIRYVNYKLWRTSVNIPDRDLSLFDVIAKLNWNNRLLNTTKWYLYHHDVKGHYQYFVLGIDGESLDELERLGFQAYYGNERVRFSIPKEYTKGNRSGNDFIRWYSSTRRIYSA